MGKQLIPPRDGGVEEIGLRDALEERYLQYALSTITGRALPDARDGLKPVHRRLLYAMRLLRLDPGAAFKKCARVVGDVIGKFHPHGDQAVYDALVRLAQDFAQRYPLVDGQGNFGNVDGDNPAAMRYTEARLTQVAHLLLDGIEEDAIDFRPTYDGSEKEPVVLPGAFPNLLANGSQGIAVGMATAIPPHNAAEICDAALHLIDTPNARSRTLLKYVPGPDFPTGGVIVDSPADIAEAYTSGRGSFRVRARWHKEDTGRGTYLIVIIRNEDEPKPVLMKSFKLSDLQADAILNMRLRNLRKLEEIEIKQEDKQLRAERKSLSQLIGSETEQWKKVADEIKKVRATFGPKTALGKRRTTFGQAPEHDEAAIEQALVEREPITVVVSEKGWIRTLRGTISDLSSIAFKADDGPKFVFAAETTSKCLVVASNGRFYTLDAAKLPGGRGHGEPIRLFIDLEQEADVVAVFPHQGGRKFLLASAKGRGFVVAEDECLANTRKGKQVLNVAPPDAARAVATVTGELVASIGENRKMLIFPLDQVPEMARGRGVRLQRYKDGGLSDVKTFKAEEGLSWTDTAGRAFSLTFEELADWRGNRADAGRLAPKGFPRTNTFSQLRANRNGEGRQ